MASTLPFMPSDDDHIDVSALETWLWEAACVIRGTTDAPKFKDFILPLIFYKRLSDVFDDEFKAQIEIFGSEEIARQVIEADHHDALQKGRNPIVRFFLPAHYCWENLRKHSSDDTLGEFVTDAMRDVAKLNPTLIGVLDVKDYNERQSGERAISDERLESLIEVLSRHRLGLRNTEPDILGRAYEYLLRKFAEGQGQSAGEFYTPKEVGWLIAELINPAPMTTIYDPTCGSGGLLIKARLLYEQRHTNPDEKTKSPKLFGQELNPVTFAMAKMNMFLHDYTNSSFAIGDTMRTPKFSSEGAGLQHFDYVVSNPMWNQKGYEESLYSNDRFSRFEAGAPPSNTADWGWVQHIAASLNENGRAAIVLDTGAVSRGSGSKGSDKERDVRKAFVEKDWIEAVILLPDNLFYNTSAPGIILVLNRNKPEERKGQILLINASLLFEKGKPKNMLTDAGIAAVAGAYHAWETREKLGKVVTIEDVRGTDYNLSPSLFVEVNRKIELRSLNEIMVDLELARTARKKADADLSQILYSLGLERRED